MKSFILFFMIIFSQFQIAAQSVAKIEFANKNLTLNFGTISKATDNGERIFEFTNTGNAPLVIKNVQSTCGCTIPTKPEAPILPGKTGQIKVKYEMKTGPIRKTITVETNAVNYENGLITLKIKGEVVESKK